MATIALKYGRGTFDLDFDPGRFEVIRGSADKRPMSDVEIGERLDAPIDSARLEEIVEAGNTVLIVVPDATRRTGAGQIVNLVVRRLIANGTAPHEITIIFATGIHRKVTDDEKSDILTSFIAQRIKTIDHDPRDLARLVNVGTTSGGIPIELNRAILDHDHVVVVGGVTFHYFAGFTGGRKLICPGLASARTISATHKLAFDCETLSRREGVDTGVLDGNAVHDAFMECVGKVPPSFAITTVTDDAGNIVDLYCGDWQRSHRFACDEFAATSTAQIPERRQIVVASCGGYPYDLNMIQAHKTLDAAARACTPGGNIVLVAECPDGLGRADFADWFSSSDSRELGERLCEKYQVNGQTAWNLLRIAETHHISIVTDFDEAVVTKMRLRQTTPEAVTALINNKNARGYLMPAGAKLNIKIAT